MSELNKTQLEVENQASFPDNNEGLITPAILRGFNTDMIDSLVDEISYTATSASFNSRINAITPGSGSYATTGSNTFTGNQFVNADLVITASHELQLGNNVGSLGTNGTIVAFNTNGGYQQRNFTSGDYYMEQYASSPMYISNRGGQQIEISGSSTLIQGVDFIPFSSSLNSRINAITGSGGSGFATTGSNIFYGNQQVSGSVLPLFQYGGELGSDSQRWTRVYTNEINGLSNLNLDKIRFNNSTLPIDFNQARQLFGTGTGAGTTLYYGTGSNVGDLRELAYVPSGSGTTANMNTLSASFASTIANISGSNINTASFATTGSNTFRGDQRVNGDLYVTGSDTNHLLFTRTGGPDVLKIGVSDNAQTYEIQVTGSGSPTTMWLIDNQGGTRINTFAQPTIANTWLRVDGTFTSSLAEGYIFLGNSSNKTSNYNFTGFSQSVDTRINNIVTGTGFATTGSNTFTGNQLISKNGGEFQIQDPTNPSYGTTSFGISGASGGLTFKQSGSVIIEGNAGSKNLTFYGTGSFVKGIGVSDNDFIAPALITYNTTTDVMSISKDGAYQPSLNIEGGLTASLQQGYVWVGNASGRTTTVPTSSFGGGSGAGFPYTGDAVISGSLLVSGSNNVDVNILSRLAVVGPATGQTPQLYVSGSDGAITTIGRFSNNINTTKATSALDASGQIYANTSSVAGQYIGVYDDPNFNTDVELATRVSSNGIEFADWDNATVFDYVPFMTIAPNLGDNPPVNFKRNVNVTGSVDITGQFTINGIPISGSNISGFATTGSNSFNGNQTITGSLNVRAISTFNPAATTPSTLNVGSGSVLYFRYSDIGAAYPSIYNIQPGWVMSGTGITNGTVTNAYGDMDWYAVEITSGNVVSGSSYLGTGPFYPFLDISGAVYSDGEIRAGGGSVSVQKIDGTGINYPNVYLNVDTATDPTNVFGSLAVDGHTSEARMQFALSSYTPMHPSEPVPTIYAGGYYDAGTGYGSTDTTICFYSSSIEMWMPTKFKTNVEISSSVAIKSGSFFPQATGSALVAWNAATGQLTHTTYQSTLASLFDVGAFSSTTTQSGSANVSASFQFDTTSPINEITLTNGSHINIPKSAYYNFQFSIQIVQGSGAADVAVWLKKNGGNVPASATYITVPSNQKSVLSLNLWDSGSAGDYYELAYQSDNANTTYAYVAPTGNIPASPSVILTVNQVR